MIEAEIIAAIRRGIREPSSVSVTDTDISAVITRGVSVLGLQIIDVDPSFLNVRKSIASASSNHVFPKPSDCLNIINIWDLGANAVSITGAADSGTGEIRITAVAHGLSDGAVAVVHDVGGCTEANGTWTITYVGANTFDLDSSTFTNTYTSGGKVYEDPSDPDLMERIDIADATLEHVNKWYPRKNDIVVDESGFDNDLLIDYTAMPTKLSDINSAFHEWLVSFGITDLMMFEPQAPDYPDKQKTFQFHIVRQAKVEKYIQTHYRASLEPAMVRNTFGST